MITNSRKDNTHCESQPKESFAPIVPLLMIHSYSLSCFFIQSMNSTLNSNNWIMSVFVSSLLCNNCAKASSSSITTAFFFKWDAEAEYGLYRKRKVENSFVNFKLILYLWLSSFLLNFGADLFLPSKWFISFFRHMVRGLIWFSRNASFEWKKQVGDGWILDFDCGLCWM